MCKVILVTPKALVTMNINNCYYFNNDDNDTSGQKKTLRFLKRRSRCTV